MTTTNSSSREKISVILARTFVSLFLFFCVTGLHLMMSQQGVEALGLVQAQDDSSVKKDLTNRLSEEKASRWIIDAVGRIPKDVRAPKGMSIVEIQNLTDQILLKGEEYLRDYPKGKNVSEVIPALCRVYLMNSNRHFLDSARVYKENRGQSAPALWTTTLKKNYFGRIHDLLNQEFGKTDSEGETPCQLIRLRADTFWHQQKYPQASAQYKLILNNCPEAEERDVVRCALLNAQFKDRDHRGATQTADDFLKLNSDSDLLPHVLGLKAKALVQSGRMSESLAWWKSIEGIIENAVQGDPLVIGDKTIEISDRCRKDFQRYYEELHFSIGYIEFALGNYKAAAESFTREMDLLNDLINSQSISQVGQIYAKRTERVLDTMLRFAGKPTPVVDLGPNWVGSVTFDPKQEQGNVLLLLFAPYENQRYFETLSNLQKLYMTHGNDGLRVAWISNSKGNTPQMEQMDRIAAQCREMGLAFPAGIDLGEGSPTFAEYNSPLGGGSIIAVNRKGEFCWYKLDPTFRDDSVISQVARRLLEDSP
ncbi:MAG: hypothetical protein H8E43_07070 [Planctomycetia bacterium]|nr:hypothetical protein [Planctomycetia bacterium]MBL6915760.1 hypothetical protein [Planctomycetota bacterium]